MSKNNEAALQSVNLYRYKGPPIYIVVQSLFSGDNILYNGGTPGLLMKPYTVICNRTTVLTLEVKIGSVIKPTDLTAYLKIGGMMRKTVQCSREIVKAFVDESKRRKLSEQKLCTMLGLRASYISYLRSRDTIPTEMQMKNIMKGSLTFGIKIQAIMRNYGLNPKRIFTKHSKGDQTGTKSIGDQDGTIVTPLQSEKKLVSLVGKDTIPADDIVIYKNIKLRVNVEVVQ